MDPLKFSISAQALCWCLDEMTYTSFQGAQSPWSWASRPSCLGGTSASFSFLDQTVGAYRGSPYVHSSFPSPPMHLPPCWCLGSPFCSYQCTLVSLELSLQITEQDPQYGSLSVLSWQKHAVFIHIMPRADLLVSLMGIELGATITGTQQHIIKVITNLSLPCLNTLCYIIPKPSLNATIT